MKKTFLLFLLFQTCFFVFPQDKHLIDSLQSVVHSSIMEDTTKVKALIYLSQHYQEYDSGKGLEFGNKALLLAQTINYKKGTGKAHNNLGDIYWYRGDFASSSDHYLKALNIFQQLNNKKEIALCYRNIGWIYSDQNNFKQALDYYNKAFNMNLELHNKKGLVQNYNDIGIIYAKQKEYLNSNEYFKKALAIQEGLNGHQDLSSVYGNIAVNYGSLGKTDLAIEYTEKALKMAETEQNRKNLSYLFTNLGGLYIKKGKYESAGEAIGKGLRFAKEINYKVNVKEAYQNFALLYAAKKEFEKAYIYADSVSILKDSLYNENNSRLINEMTGKYESEKKELTIQALEKDKALSDEKFQREKNFKIYLSVFCLLIVVIAFVLFRGNVQKKKANNALSHAYKEIEVKNKDITDSINYSKRIQEASLPPRELKYRLFPDAFVFFKPKDIVSGDFYWYAEKDGKRLIAACDCTGHGVPGALMSMLGNNILNQLVNEKAITAPDQILNNLHVGIRKALKQEENPESRDGMDIALVVFNSENEIEFSGAQRPLWIIKKNDNGKLIMDNANLQQLTPVGRVEPSNNYQLQEIKGNKFSIGGMQTEDHRVYTNTKITLAKGDSIYFFSDGYVDQFGGEDGKKFMSKNFKKLLLTIHTEPMAKQEILITEALEKWTNRYEQADDVLVIGVKI